MTIQLVKKHHGKQLAIHVGDKLAKADYKQFVPAFELLLQQHGIAMFCKPFTTARAQYFDHADAMVAWKWLDEA